MSQNGKYCKNPKTNRYIEIGGRTWRRLMKEGIIDQGNYKDPNVLYELADDNTETVEDRRAHLIQEKARIVKTKKIPKGYHLAMSKNKKIVYQRAKMTNEESSRKTADAALEVVDAIQNNELEIPEDMSRTEARDYLQGLIFNQMLAGGKKFKNTKLEKLGRMKKIPVISKQVRKPVRAPEVLAAKQRKPRSIQDYMPSRRKGNPLSNPPTRGKLALKKPVSKGRNPSKKVKFAPTVKSKKEKVYYLPEEEEEESEEDELVPINQYSYEEEPESEEEEEEEYEEYYEEE